MIKRYLIKKLFFPFLLFAIVVGIFQNSYIQNKLINAFLPSGYSFYISKIKGFFPFCFSANDTKLSAENFDINIEELDFQVSKKLTCIKNIDIKRAEIKTKDSNSDFSISNIRYFLPLFGQKVVRKININELVINNNPVKNINFYYDKAKRENYLNLDSPYGKILMSWKIDMDQILVKINLNQSIIKASYNFKNNHINLDYNFEDQKINFNGNVINKSLKGIITFPYGIKFDSEIALDGNILKADLKNKKFDIFIKSRFDFNKFIIFIDNMTFRNLIKIKPFVIKDFSKVSDIIILLKKGMIKIADLDFSRNAFFLGNYYFQNVDFSQFQELNCSGILNGSAEYKKNSELIKLKLDNMSYDFVKIQSMIINANYSRDDLNGQILFNIYKLKNQADFKISLQNWLFSDKSKLENVSQGIFHIADYKLPNKQILNGDISYNIKSIGKLRNPELSGKLSLKKGSYINPIYGIYIKDITFDGRFANNNFIIDNIFAIDDSKKKGNIKGNGKIDLKNTGDANIFLKVNNLKLIDQNYFKGRLFGELNLNGNIFKKLSIMGKLYTNDPVLDISGILLMASRNIDILDNVYSVEKSLKPKTNNITSFPVEIPVNIDFKFNPNLKIIGFGVDSVWEGGAIINGDLPDIKYQMDIRMKQGKMDLINDTVFKLKNGNILINNFKNDISLSAEKKIEKVMVGARFQQINNSSRISFYSTPYLSDKDIMSYMLFDKPTSEISAGEGLALFSAMTKLSGHSSFDILDKMKTAFGIDSISIKKNIDSNQEEYNAISIGKKIGKFKVSVDQGTASDTTGVVVEADIAKNVKMSVDLNGRDSATAGILWSRRY